MVKVIICIAVLNIIIFLHCIHYIRKLQYKIYDLKEALEKKMLQNTALYYELRQLKYPDEIPGKELFDNIESTGIEIKWIKEEDNNAQKN